MIFEYIELNNYRQYQKARIDFPDIEEGKNFFIIKGNNGTGKTNLLNAITWCLYGKEYNIRNRDKSLPLLNLSTFEEMENGEQQEVSVEIKIRRGKNEKIIIRRFISFKKEDNEYIVNKNFKSQSADGSTVILFIQRGKDQTPVSNPEYIINSLIPESIEEYFFFDGERLNEYFKRDSKKDVKKAVFRIAQIDLLEKLIDHLDKVKGEFIREAKSTTPSLQTFSNERDNKTKQLEDYKEQLEKYRLDKKEIEIKILEYRHKLRKTPVDNVKELDDKRLKLKDDIESLNERLKTLNAQKISFLMDSAPVLFLYEPIISVYEELNKKFRPGKFPPDIQSNFVEILLDEGKCICGTDLENNQEAREKILSTINKDAIQDDKTIPLMQMHSCLKHELNAIKIFDEKRLGMNKTITDYETNIEEKQKEIDDISKLFQTIDENQIMLWEAKLQEWERRKEDVIGKLYLLETQKKSAIKDIAELDKQLKKEMKKDDINQKLLKKISFCDKALEEATKIRKEIMIEIKNEIEDKTQSQFEKLIWKTSEWKSISIDDDYNVSLKHRSGLESIGSLSAGEGIILTMSFMAAINIVSGFDSPIIIDTPLGRLSGEIREKIAKNLPNFLPEKQVTMLVTDTEYTDNIGKLLSKRVAKEYNIKFIETEKGGIAEVV